MNHETTNNNWVDEKYPVKTVELDNRVVSYREAGSKNNNIPVMAVLHGIGSGSGSWVNTMSYFENKFHVLAWDAPGYNFSTSLPDDKPDALDYAKAFDQFVNNLGVKPEIVIGHSLGAMIAGSYAAMSDASLPILILANPANGYGKALPKEREKRLHDRLNMVRDFGPDGMAEKRSGNLLSQKASPDALELVKWNMRKVTLRGYEQASHTLSNGSLIDDALNYDGKVLVICGDEDQVTPVLACKSVAKAYINAPFKILKGLGHATYVEGSKQFNNAIADFLEGTHV